MAYGFDTSTFSRLGGRLRDYPDPEGVPEDSDTLSELSESYIAAAAALFHLMLLIMRARFSKSPRGERYQIFLSIYEDRVAALINELQEFLLGGLRRGEISAVRDFIEGVRRSALANELEALQYAVESSSGEGADAEADASAGETVTNSLKEQIERRVGRKWIKDILHAINEVLAVARGVT
jgi:hypothetical protein